tara:strand:+ start:166 stop:387 length:222 start_codon:yes stop_codon:yes gene_type:complete
MNVHAFLLVLLLGDVQQGGQPMYFRDVERCNYFASEIVKRYGNYGHSYLVPQEHRATAYCKPVFVPNNTATLY